MQKWILMTSILLPLTACAVQQQEEEPQGTTNAAFTGRIPEMVETTAPRGAPRSWQQPDSEGLFGRFGYCGATAAANLLGWYRQNVSPRQAIDGGCWSNIGTLPSSIANYLSTSFPDLGCAAGTLPYEADSLASLRNAVGRGHPVLIEFMTGGLDAHWVTVIGFQGAGNNPKVVVMSWGGFYTIQWDALQDAWRHAWGGYYPYIICRAVSPMRSALTQQ